MSIISKQPPPSLQPTAKRKPTNIPPCEITQIALTTPRHLTNQTRYTTVHHGLGLAIVFLITFLVINYLLRPFTYMWTLIFLPILIPVPFLVFPFLFKLKPYPTFGCQLGGFGFGAIFLLFVLG